MPTLTPPKGITSSVATVGGFPQTIYSAKLEDEVLKGLSVPDLLDRLIIGPTEQPMATYQLFKDVLRDAKVPNFDQKIAVSGIPLRTAAPGG